MATRKYRIDPNRLPKLSTSFESFRAEQLAALLTRVKPSFTQKAPATGLKKLTVSKELPRVATKQKRTKSSKANTDKAELETIKKAWAYIIKKDMPRAHRGMIKQRSDIRNNDKRLAQLCSREVQKKANRMQKEAKEAPLRGKRLLREMVTYWRRRERETADMKRKREKEEQDLRKKREEEEEAMRQRQRLEYIMRTSVFYSNFMAQKLGIAPTYNSNISSIQVDEESAKENARSLIRDNRDHLKKFGDNEGSNEDLKDVGLLGLDKVEDNRMISRIEAPPQSFKGDLKDYQMKGLRWLDSLFSQGINGILADEMGLGKTIQTIALLGHLSSNKGIWGPFLIVCPSSTLHNWQAELDRFCPALKVLPYWGGIKERKALRRYLNNRKLGYEDSPFHVCITSYQLVLADEKIFQKIMWRYMVLDEAHAIKNTQSQRWKILLGFNARNKLLLTGTPIQNSMAELWALLHFIMPSLFDSHEQFQEWFSKDIEAHSFDSGSLNQQQLQRLHAILKPFMLRRVKKDVESEIGQKTEHEYFCDLTNRQRVLYHRIKSKLNISELFSMADSKTKVENLMNLMMQFRKVCNHPDLFERRPEQTPLMFKDHNIQLGSLNPGFNQLPEIRISNMNPMNYTIPRLVYDQLFLENKRNLFLLNALSFEITKFLGLSIGEAFRIYLGNDIMKGLAILKYLKFVRRMIQYEEWTQPMFLINNPTKPIIRLKYEPLLVTRHISRPKILATPIHFLCSSINFTLGYTGSLNSPQLKKLIMGPSFHPANFFEAAGQSRYDSNLRSLEDQIPCNVDLPSVEKLVSDSAKLKLLDGLLKQLHKDRHRVLIFCQMTKMLDILEDYLYYRHYQFLRMDGNTAIGNRRDLITEFQSNENIFVFILSTRAGGLGVNLTAADTVIFYDIDWNPTMDAQATDRVHRIGQTKEVTVYRLITSHTVEERILKRAKQKQTVQSTVYAGGAFKADIFKPSEVMELLLDEGELDSVSQTQKFMGMVGGKRKTKKPDEAFNAGEVAGGEIN
jgi:DNA helicase INO80